MSEHKVNYIEVEELKSKITGSLLSKEILRFFAQYFSNEEITVELEGDETTSFFFRIGGNRVCVLLNLLNFPVLYEVLFKQDDVDDSMKQHIFKIFGDGNYFLKEFKDTPVPAVFLYKWISMSPNGDKKLEVTDRELRVSKKRKITDC